MTRRYVSLTCQYCGGEYFSNSIGLHIVRCAMSPKWYEPTRKMLDDGTGRIVPCDVYRAKQDGTVITSNGLRKQIGGWDEVAAAFGLTHDATPRSIDPATVVLRECPDVDTAAHLEDMRVLEVERLAPRGLNAYRVAVTDVTGIVGTPMGDVVMRCVVERMMLR